MRPLAPLAALVLPPLVAALGAGGRAAVTPTQKVVELLTGMLTKGQDEKHKEEVAYSAFAEFCRTTEAHKGKAIDQAASDIVALEADIAAADAAAAELGEGISQLDAELDGIASEKAKATALRKQESDDFQATYADYSESLDALDKAISTLKARAAPTTIVELQRHFGLPLKAQRALGSLLEAAQAPKANAYDFQSGDIVGMLEKLRLKFQDEREQLHKEEMNRKHNFELLAQRFADDAEHASQSRSDKASRRGEKQAQAAEARGDLISTQAAKAADESYQRDLVANCATKAQEFQERQTLRAGELEALQQAIDIISSPAVSGAADRHLPAAALLQRPAGRALAQLRGEASSGGDVGTKLQALLSERAKQLDSSLLSVLAQQAAENPFQKVAEMIKDLLVKLMDEANSEADHHAWCTSELEKNQKSRDSLTTEVETLSAKADELGALEATLATEAKELAAAIADVDAAVNTATADRQAEKAANQQTIAEAKAAQAAVTQAVEVLRKFYDQASEATSLLQRGAQSPAEDSPATWGEAYRGMQGESGGVFGMLEVVQSDFSRLETETTVAEQAAERSYQQFLEDSSVDRAAKDKEMRHKGYKRDSTLRILRETKKDLRGSQEELDEALDYHSKLKPACIDTGLSYEDRVQKRREEIQSLKEALRILGGEDLP